MKVLLLNQSYSPIKIVSWRKAVNLVIGREIADIIEEYEDSNMKFKPAVIRLRSQAPDLHSLKGSRIFSKKKVFIRDQYICQYCSALCVGKDATIDHVLPRYAGGKSTFDNCVTACRACNQKKGHKTMEEARMSLIKSDYTPKWSTKVLLGLTDSDTPKVWENYL